MQLITIAATDPQLAHICSFYLGCSVNTDCSEAERHASLTTHVQLYKLLPQKYKDEIKKFDDKLNQMPKKEIIQSMIALLQKAHDEL